jgi:hypothetical protein
VILTGPGQHHISKGITDTPPTYVDVLTVGIDFDVLEHNPLLQIVNNDHIHVVEQRLRVAINEGLDKDRHEKASVKCYPVIVSASI